GALLLTLNQAGYLHGGFNWAYLLFSLMLLSLALTSFNMHKSQLPQEQQPLTTKEQQHYRDIFHNAVEGMFTTTLDGRLQNANQALLNILGYTTLDELKQAIAGT